MIRSKSRCIVSTLDSSRGSHPAASISHSAPMSITGIVAVELFSGSAIEEVERLHVLFEMFDARGAGDRQHDRRAFQQPCERLGGRNVELPDLQREPWDEADVVLLAVIEHAFPF